MLETDKSSCCFPGHFGESGLSAAFPVLYALTSNLHAVQSMNHEDFSGPGLLFPKLLDWTQTRGSYIE